MYRLRRVVLGAISAPSPRWGDEIAHQLKGDGALGPMSKEHQRLGAAARVVLWLALAGSGCQLHRAAVRLSLERSTETPRDASVYIDERFVGFLGVVAARGVTLPEGEHRITVEKVGYFPWDELVVSSREPIQLKVELRRIPD